MTSTGDSARSLSVLGDGAFMTALLNVVVPPSVDGKLPGAGALKLAEQVATALEGDSAVEAGLGAVREAAGTVDGGFAAMELAEQVALVESQAAAHAGLMAAVTRAVYLAYYQHPAVLVGIGEPGRPRYPEGFVIDPTDPELLAMLQARARRS